jgi:hypothetical protein
LDSDKTKTTFEGAETANNNEVSVRSGQFGFLDYCFQSCELLLDNDGVAKPVFCKKKCAFLFTYYAVLQHVQEVN